MNYFFVLTSSALQVVAAVVAWRVAASGRARLAWRTVAVAILLMAIRRVAPLGGDVAGVRLVELIDDALALIISVLLLAGVVRMRGLWLMTERARQRAERERQARKEAEERWQRVFEFAPYGYIILALDGKVDRMNRAACEIAGVEAAQAEGRYLFELGLLDEEGLALAAKNLHLLQQHNDPGPAEYTIHRRDGSKRMVEIVGYALEEAGRPLMLTLVHDITERRRTEAELHKIRVRLEEAQKVAGLITWELDLATGALWLSQNPGESVGTASHVMPLDASLQYVHPDDRACVAESIARAINDPVHGDVAAEYRQIDMDGRERTSRTVARSEVDEAGRVVRLLGATLDITEIRQAEREIRALNADLEARVRERTSELERAVAELEAFSYSVSHDLRSPLRAMAGYSEMVIEEQGEAMDAASRERLQRIRASSMRMATMIDDLLSLARLTRAVRRDEQVDVSALARSIVEELRLAEPGRTVEVTVDEGLEVRGDAGMLRIVLQNLIANAWKFTRDATDARIEIGRHSSGAYFVRDNGVGFDAAQSSKLFRPFERLHRVDEFEGSGIGLATVERIVRRHGGSVWAEGAVGHGSTFYFTLGAEPAKVAVSAA